jgi:cobalamin biosynthesis Mg chelatase CobN
MMPPERRVELRRALRIGPVLAVAAVAGYVLGGCGGGDLSGLMGLSDVTELPTGSRPSLTIPTVPTEPETAPATTVEAPTTAPEPPPTQPATTVVETEATEAAPTEPATTSTVPTDTAGEPPSEGRGLLGWLALAIAAAQGEETTSGPEAAPETNGDTNRTETVAAEPASSETGTPWGWIVLAMGLVLAAVIVGVVVWRRRRHRPEGG